MSNLLVNIRILDWHIQLCSGCLIPEINRNAYHRENGYPHGWFTVYQFFGYSND